jgi:outer membrane protein assembly factor BamB
MFRHDLQHTGRSPYTGPETPMLKWSYNAGDYIASSPAIGIDGTVYVGCWDRNLYAINSDGSLKWSYTTGGIIYYSSPAIGADGTIYVGSVDHKLHAINPDGSPKWSYTTGAIIHSSPAIGADGTIYVGSRDNKLYAIKPDGTLKWSFPTGADIYSSSPAIGTDGTIYVGSRDRKLYAINPDGSLKWSFPTGADIYSSSPAIGADGTIYVGSHDGNLYAINPDGSPKWSYFAGAEIYSSPAIGADGTIYVGSRDGKLYAINPDGSPKWSYFAGISYSSPAIGGDGTIYVGSRDDKLYAINSDGSLKWSYTIGWFIESSPAIGADGTIYVGSYDGKLYAITSGNQPPVAHAGGPYTANEGDSVALDGSQSSDPGGYIALYEWDLDNDGQYDDATGATTDAIFDDNGSFIVGLRVTDELGASDTDVAEVTVDNVAPGVGSISAPTDPVAIGTPITVNATFTDPGVLDTHTAVWDWGDNTTSEGTVDETNGSGSVTGNRTYNATGVYTVTLTVTDDDAGSGQSVFQYVVLYDPSAGFVTGGGWIDSPEGAYTPATSLTGKANFGFVSKYKKGADTPSGETEFQFRVADLNFHSTTYQWLVIAGPKAKFKGSGTINGSGDYGFMLTATDGQINGGGGVDKFRIKIWDKQTGEVIYDNQLGDADEGDATQAIGGGSIVIHAK